jgi:hypothetical protein
MKNEGKKKEVHRGTEECTRQKLRRGDLPAEWVEGR